MKRVIVNVDVNVIAVMTMMDSDLQKTELTIEEIAQKYMRENHTQIKGWTEGHFCKYEEESPRYKGMGIREGHIKQTRRERKLERNMEDIRLCRNKRAGIY